MLFYFFFSDRYTTELVKSFDVIGDLIGTIFPSSCTTPRTCWREGGVPPGTRGGQTWGGIRSIPTVNLVLSVPYAQEAVEVTLGPVEMNGNGFPRGPGTAQPCTRPSWCLG